MGILKKMKAFNENAQALAARNGSIDAGRTTLRVFDKKGGGGVVQHNNVMYPVEGASAYVESGAHTNGRMTATRVVGGAVLLGPLGAIIGGMAKKDRNKVYLVIELANGSVLSADFPAKEEVKVREFAGKVNAASQHWTSQAMEVGE